MKYRGFGRVQVLGLVITQHAPAKTDVLAFDVADGEHHSVAKPVVTLATVVVIDDDQAALLQQRVVVLGENAGQAAPAFGRVSQAIPFGHSARDASALEIINGTL